MLDIISHICIHSSLYTTNVHDHLSGILARSLDFHGWVIQLTLMRVSAYYPPYCSKDHPETPKQNTLSLLFSSLQTKLFLFQFVKSAFYS